MQIADKFTDIDKMCRTKQTGEEEIKLMLLFLRTEYSIYPDLLEKKEVILYI